MAPPSTTIKSCTSYNATGVHFVAHHIHYQVVPLHLADLTLHHYILLHHWVEWSQLLLQQTPLHLLQWSNDCHQTLYISSHQNITVTVIIILQHIYSIGTQCCEVVVRYSYVSSNNTPVSLSAWVACLTASQGHENPLVVTFPSNFTSFSGGSGKLSILDLYNSVGLNAFLERNLLSIRLEYEWHSLTPFKL